MPDSSRNGVEVDEGARAAELADVVGGERRDHVGRLGPTGPQRLVDLVVGDVADDLDVDVGVRLLERVDRGLDRLDLAVGAPAVPEGDGGVGVRVVVRRRPRSRRCRPLTASGRLSAAMAATGAASVGMWSWFSPGDGPGRARRCGAALDGVEDLVAGGGECGLQGAGEHRVARGRRTARAGAGSAASEPTWSAIRSRSRGAAGGEHAAGQHDEGRVDHGDHGGDAEREPLGERGEQLVAGARGGRAPGRPRPAAWWRGCPSDRARASTCRPPASSWKPPALPRRTSRTSGVPGSGRKPTSPAPPVAPPWMRPSITIAAPSPSSAHSSTKSSTPRARPERSSAMAARFTSLSDVERHADARRASRSSRWGSCQPGRCRA